MSHRHDPVYVTRIISAMVRRLLPSLQPAFKDPPNQSQHRTVRISLSLTSCFLHCCITDHAPTPCYQTPCVTVHSVRIWQDTMGMACPSSRMLQLGVPRWLQTPSVVRYYLQPLTLAVSSSLFSAHPMSAGFLRPHSSLYAGGD